MAKKRSQTQRETDQQLIRRVAWVLDSAIPIPGTRFRIGLDAIIGLIPWVGDVAGSVMSMSILGLALRVGASRWTLLRMAYNILIETIVGSIPFFGDLFDAFWKANERNVALLERSTLDLRAGRKDLAFLAFLIGGLIGALALAIWGSFELTLWFLREIRSWFQGY